MMGQVDWSKVILTSSQDRALSTAVSPVDGSVVVVGEATSGEPYLSPIRPHGGGTLDGFVSKYDPDGGLIWATFLGAGGADACRSVALDEDGDIYVTGTFENFGGFVPFDLPGDHQGDDKNDAFIAKLDTDGQVLWFHTFGGDKEDYGLAVSLHESQVFMVMNVDFNNFSIDGVIPSGAIDDGKRHYALLAMNKETGDRNWFYFLGSEDDDYANGPKRYEEKELSNADLVVDDSGVNLLLGLANSDLNLSSNTGANQSIPGLNGDANHDPILIHFSLSGAYQWVKSVGASMLITETSFMKVTADCDHIYVVLSANDLLGLIPGSIILFKIAKSDQSQVYSRIWSVNNFDITKTLIHDLTCDRRGRVLAAGQLEGTITLQTASGSEDVTHNTSTNFMMLNIRASDGQVQSQHHGGNSGFDVYYGIHVSRNAHYWVVGSGQNGDEVSGANVNGSDAALATAFNSSNNILIRNQTGSMIDIGSCCSTFELISGVSASPQMFCSGQNINLNATGNFDAISWYSIDGSTWTPIANAGTIPPGGTAQVAAIATKACGAKDT